MMADLEFGRRRAARLPGGGVIKGRHRGRSVSELAVAFSRHLCKSKQDAGTRQTRRRIYLFARL